MVGSRSQIVAVAATLGLLFGASGAARADAFAWAPADAPAVTRGREVARRFGLLQLIELTVEVDNAYSAANRAALASAEQRLAEIPGVRRVFGPARLLDISVDASGKASARAVLSRGSNESDGEEARQRVVRRADALGWFVSANGRVVRFFVDTGDLARVRGACAAALAASGLGLVAATAGDGLAARTLWPDPRARGARWWPAAFAAAWVLFIALVGFKARPLMGGFSRGRGLGVTLAAAAGAAAPFAFVPVAGVRGAGALAALAAALAVGLGLAFERRRGPRPVGWNRFPRPPVLVLLLALAPFGAFAAFAQRLAVGTHQWSATPLFFVDVRADLDNPVVLREVQRLVEFLRAQPGVASAWSVADLFAGVDVEGQEASRVPSDVDDVRDVLSHARIDPAVALELAADHREGLVVVRFDEGAEASTDRLDLTARLAAYLDAELRAWLLPVDLRAGDLPLVTRGLAKGLLASDTRDRIVGICERSGRPLTQTELLAVERVSRQTAAVPTADPARLAGELADDLRDFVRHDPVALRASEQARVVEALVALPDDETVDGVARALAGVYGARLSPPVLADTAAIVARRMAIVRWRHTARINFHEMLFGADLPTDGVLADEVRSATLEGMGPDVGIPVAPESPGALHLDAVAFGGAANDRALSDAWRDSLRFSAIALVLAWAVLLALVGGPGGLAWLPLALAPASAAALAPALVREPLGLWGMSFLGGALAAGAVVAAAFAARRRR
ncbi:MAG TPA: hypothetical protein VLA14_10310 [Polyangia bacterium]|nr:hypothetical protein [Polyangia bacterium]